jgi:hypothetical protein
VWPSDIPKIDCSTVGSTVRPLWSYWSQGGICSGESNRAGASGSKCGDKSRVYTPCKHAYDDIEGGIIGNAKPVNRTLWEP